MSAPRRRGGVRSVLLALLAPLLLATGCWRPPPPPDARPPDRPARQPDGDAEPAGTRSGEEPPAPPAEAVAAEVERLRKLGPIYTPYETGPRLVWNVDSERLLTERLLPVLRERDLPARTHALYWVLVAADGSVADVVLQTSSEVAPFDEAAAEVARRLRFRPAVTNGRPHAVWVIRDISLLMQ